MIDIADVKIHIAMRLCVRQNQEVAKGRSSYKCNSYFTIHSKLYSL